MYKVAYITGNSSQISHALESLMTEINIRRGEIMNIVQSQSSPGAGVTIVTITIIYKILR